MFVLKLKFVLKLFAFTLEEDGNTDLHSICKT